MNKPLLLIVAICMLCMGCKKQSCDGVVCPANRECKDGDCYLTCGPHQQLVNGHCLCDTGWGGTACDVPYAALAGRYHFVGLYIRHSVLNTPMVDTTLVDDTALVFFHNDTVFARGKRFVYTAGLNGYDAANYYLYEYQEPYLAWINDGAIGFRKSLPDTLIYKTSFGSPAVSSSTKLYGFKVQ